MEKPAKAVCITNVASGKDYIISVIVRRNVLIQFFKITVDQLVCFWKTLLCHEIFSVIHDRHMKAKHFSQMGSRLGYVTASKDHKPWILAVIFYEKPATVCFCHFCLFRLTQNIQIIIPYGSIFRFLGDQLCT